MKQCKTKTYFLIFILSTSFLFSENNRNLNRLPTNPEQFKNKIAFIENKGQIHDQNFHTRQDVLFGAVAGQMIFHLRDNGISYQLQNSKSRKHAKVNKYEAGQIEVDTQQVIYRVDLDWLYSNNKPLVITEKAIASYDNYYFENCPNGIVNVKSYNSVKLLQIYNGIDLHYYEKNGQLKHDYILAAGANYKDIRLKVKGADIKLMPDGSIILTTPFGSICEEAPIVFQNEKQLKAKWKVGNNTLSFDIENYNSKLAMVIDPLTRLWGTYYGDLGDDFPYSTSIDSKKNVYLAGHTNTNFSTSLATTGGHQTILAGQEDAFIVKFNANGTRDWGTYYGGSNIDMGFSCSNDSNSNVYLAGFTTSINSSSANVIATNFSHQSSASNQAGFLVKFDSSGARVWGTYYGDGTTVTSCSNDHLGNIYIAGYTTANNNPNLIATSGSHQASSNGGNLDAFLAKFNSSGQRLWATYYGGNSTDMAYSCAADKNGNIFISGITNTNNVGDTTIATLGSHQSIIGGGFDAFIAKFNSSGKRLFGTYYGGRYSESALSCASDQYGNVFLAGSTNSDSSTAIATINSHQPLFANGYTSPPFTNIHDAYLVKFNSSGQRKWGTYYGSYGDDRGYSCAADNNGNVYLVGTTSSGIDISTPISAYKLNYYPNGYDAFLVKFDSLGQRQFGTYYGEYGSESAISCSVTDSNNIVIAGHTNSNAGGNVISSPGSHQPIYSGNLEAFLVKFKECLSINPAASVNSPVCSRDSLKFIGTFSGIGNPTFLWNGPPAFNSSLQNPIIVSSSTLNSGDYILTVENNGCIENVKTSAVVNLSPTVQGIGIITVSCNGGNDGAFEVWNYGGNYPITFQWLHSPKDTSTFLNITAGTYIFTMTDPIGCSYKDSIVVMEPPAINVSTTVINDTVIANNIELATTFQWINCNTKQPISGAINSSFTSQIPGNYACVVSIYPCKDTTACIQIPSIQSNISNYSYALNSIDVFPNPFKEICFVKNLYEKSEINIIDALGKLIHHFETNSKEHKLELSNLDKGFYSIHIKNPNQEKFIKVLKN